ncbi:MAG: PTS sugar transporter subunit IIA [Gammaproteobacteria bacterium]|nr:PTS sugar transporter subunit IIA [Gammaproteobacteria bacterium]
MELHTLFTLEQTRCQLPLQSKKKTLEVMSEMVATQYQTGDSHTIFDALFERERLGTTGFGNGVAIPHGRIADLLQPVVLLFSLQKGIDFDAIDNQPVDILIMLLVPDAAADEHVSLLATIAELLRNQTFLNDIRACRSDRELFELVQQQTIALPQRAEAAPT